MDLLYWCRADMDGQVPGMKAFVTTEPHQLPELSIQPVECAAVEEGLTGAPACRPGDFEPGVGRARQARALRAHDADTFVSDLAEL